MYEDNLVLFERNPFFSQTYPVFKKRLEQLRTEMSAVSSSGMIHEAADSGMPHMLHIPEMACGVEFMTFVFNLLGNEYLQIQRIHTDLPEDINSARIPHLYFCTPAQYERHMGMLYPIPLEDIDPLAFSIPDKGLMIISINELIKSMSLPQLAAERMLNMLLNVFRRQVVDANRYRGPFAVDYDFSHTIGGISLTAVCDLPLAGGFL